MNLLILGVFLVLAGLAFCHFCGSAKNATLTMLVKFIGIVFIVAGLVIILFPVLAWLHRQLTEMLGIH